MVQLGFYNLSWENLKNSHLIKIITTNTKTRRLGYLKLLGSFFKEKEKISKAIISSEFETYCDKFSDDLLRYKNSKGLISITKSGTSAEPYIELADRLQLVSLGNNLYTPSKSFSVFIKCSNLWSKDNPFSIDELDRLFLFENIFKKDFFINRIILESIFYNGFSSYQQLRDEFYNLLLNRIDSLNNDLSKRELISNNLKIMHRIERWEKPKVYLEHVLMPRLNWLLDFSLINFDSSLNLEGTEEGGIFLEHVNFWDSRVGFYVANCSSIFDQILMKFYSKIYLRNNNTRYKSDLNIHFRVRELIDESFDYFRTFAPNRVTLSQAVNYVKYNLYLIDRISIEFEEIKTIIKNDLNDIYLYRYLPDHNEGYLQKK